MLEIQQAFLRRLDTFELVVPARSAGDQRRYSRADIGRVQQVVILIGEGLTLAGVRRILELEARVATLEAEIARLRRQPSSTPVDDS